jgi:tripartite-type tricarboxylate transporter receptor subunit TctC
MRHIYLLVLALLSSLANSAPITLLVGFPPGGGNYAVAQIISDAYEKLGYSNIIETKVGAGGIVGMNYCEEQVNNKNMICVVSQAQYVFSLDTPQLLKYYPEKLTYIKMIAGSPLVLITNSNNKKSVINIIKDLNSNTSPVKFANAATGNKAITQKFLRLVNAKNYVEADYKGVGDAIKDVIGNHVDYMVAPYSVVVGKESSLRIVANLGSHFNHPNLKKIETLQKTVPNLPISNVAFGLVLGSDASPSHTDFFYKITTIAMKDSDLQKKLYVHGMFMFDPNLTSLDFKNQAMIEIQEFKKWKNN